MSQSAGTNPSVDWPHHEDVRWLRTHALQRLIVGGIASGLFWFIYQASWLGVSDWHAWRGPLALLLCSGLAYLMLRMGTYRGAVGVFLAGMTLSVLLAAQAYQYPALLALLALPIGAAGLLFGTQASFAAAGLIDISLAVGALLPHPLIPPSAAWLAAASASGMALLPWVVGFIIFSAGPILVSFLLGFASYDVTSAPRFVGLRNYQLMLQDELFWQSLKVTLIYTFSSVPLGLVASLLVAIILNQKIPGLTIWRTIYYVPNVVSGVAVALLWTLIFNKQFGLLNGVLWRLFGIKGPGWISSTTWVIPSFIIMSLWGVGGSMVLYLAALQGVPTELYEAAQIDGAGTWRRFLSITIPMISPTILFNLVMGFIGTFQTFVTSYVMTNGGPQNASLFYGLYLYRNAFRYFKMGYASSLAWVLFVLILIVSLILLRSSSMWVYYETGGEGI